MGGGGLSRKEAPSAEVGGGLPTAGSHQARCSAWDIPVVGSGGASSLGGEAPGAGLGQLGGLRPLLCFPPLQPKELLSVSPAL